MTVKQAQWQLLFLEYYTGVVDGIWGPKSKAATLQFQKEFFEDDIAHDGKFGASTAAKAQEVVDRIQEILQTVVPELVDDGLAGPRTVAALKSYQEAKGLAQTGRVDDATWDTLMLEIPRQEQAETPVPEQDTGVNETTVVSFWPGIVYFKREEMRLHFGRISHTGTASASSRRLSPQHWRSPRANTDGGVMCCTVPGWAVMSTPR